MDILAPHNITAKIISAILFFSILTIIVILINSPNMLLGIGAIAIILLFLLSIAKPHVIITIIYPLLWTVGQIPLTVGGTTISLERAILIFSAVGATSMLLNRKQPRYMLPTWFTIGVLMWLSASTIALFIYPSTAGNTQVFGFLQKVVFCWLTYVFMSNTERLRIAMRCFLLSAIIASIFTWIVYLQTGNLFFIRESSYVAGTNLGENLLRGIARAGTGNSMVIWVAILEFSLARNRGSRFIWGIITVWLSITSLLALRRAVLIVLPVGYLALLLGRPIFRRSAIFTFGVIGGLFLVLFITNSDEWQKRLFEETNYTLASTQDPRTQLLQVSIQLFFQEPLFGYGPENFVEAQSKISGRSLYFANIEGIESHNAFSLAAVETGMFGLLGVVIFVSAIAFPLMKSSPTTDETLHKLWAFAPLVFIQIFSWFMFASALNLNLIWFWIGVLLAIIRLVHKDSTETVA